MSIYPIEKNNSQQDVEFQEDEKNHDGQGPEMPEIDREIEKRYGVWGGGPSRKLHLTTALGSFARRTCA
jgi:hypothetical protein